MTRRPRNRDLDHISDRAYRAAEIIPAIYAHLDEQRSNITLISAANGSGVAGGNVANPTLRIVYELDGIAYREACVKDAIASINKALNMLDDYCRAALGHRIGSSDQDGNGDPISDAPQCIVKDFIEKSVIDGEEVDVKRQCDRPVDHYIRDDGTIGWHDSGLCSMHRQDALAAQRRRVEADARRARRYAETA